MKLNEILRKELQTAYDNGFTYIFKSLLTPFKGYYVTNKKPHHTKSNGKEERSFAGLMTKALPYDPVINSQLNKLLPIKFNNSFGKAVPISDPVSIKSLLGKQFIPITKEWIEINKEANEEKDWTERKLIIL